MTEQAILYCECETPYIDIDHDAGCRRCGRPVNFGPKTSDVTHDHIADLEQAVGFEEWGQ